MKGVGSNSIFYNFCKHWVHQKCSGIKTKLKDDQNFKCKLCYSEMSQPEPSVEEVFLGNEPLEVVKSFCYLGDMTDESGGCFDATTVRIRCAWKNFRDLLPVLTNKGISLKS